MSTLSHSCFHCGLTISAGRQYPLTINDNVEFMCCPGCLAVCESIISLGLSDYYQFRENLPETSPQDIATEQEQLEFYDHEKILNKFVTVEEDQLQSISLMVNGIVCSACTWLIETRLSKVPGISVISVNQSTSRASIKWDPKQTRLSSILKAINQLGYQAHPYDQKLREQQLIDEKKRFLKKLAVAGLGMMQVMMYSLGFYLDTNLEMSATTATLLRWVSLLISTPVVFYSASLFYLSAFKSLKNYAVNMDVPVTLAIFSAWFASLWATVSGQGEVYFDSVSMFVFFLLTGRYLQMIAVHRSGRVLEEKLKTKPETVIRLKDWTQEMMLLDDILPSDILLVKPGQQIPCDSVIESGATTIDESILTGESVPLLRGIGDEVAAGSVNTGNVITIKVISSAKDSTLAGIISLLEKAQQAKPELQQMADRMASHFVTVVLLLSLLTGLYWSWQDSSLVFTTVLAVLVVTCPCALSLATPVAITTGIGVLTKQSLLLIRTASLLHLSKITDIVFDKTGTLTTGRFKLMSLSNFSKKPDHDILQIISLLESHSDHPIASAFAVDSNNEKSFVTNNVVVCPLKGITGTINGQLWQFGNKLMLGEINCPEPSAELLPDQLQLFLMDDQQCQAMVILETELREDAKITIEQLKNSGFMVHLLSGDQHSNVQQMSSQLGFDHFQAEQSPEQKLVYIKKLQGSGKNVAMVGDGINDSPAMAAALVSFAIAKSTDITKVSADIIMLAEKLSLIINAIDTSKAVNRVIKQNLFWALSYNLVGLPLAVTGLLSPWLAAAGMSLSSLVVVLNALRFSRIRY